MCSYNAMNGVPTCADHNLLSTTARNTWNFNGYITGDCVRRCQGVCHTVRAYVCGT
eukprot:m.90030 g.90030  ORF g.90030 m.90030 type:complete len:56 (-) comp11803_c0_seq1:1613-1780(-)